jgi:hypothetical protein
VASRLFEKAHPAWPVVEAPDLEEQVHRQNADLNLKCIRVRKHLSIAYNRAYTRFADKPAATD